MECPRREVAPGKVEFAMAARAPEQMVVAIVLCVLSAAGPPATCGAAGEIQKTFHVSPAGSDEAPGTETEPFGTVRKAGGAVRAVNHKMTGDIVVVLRGGSHAIGRTLVLDHRDSGTNGHNVVYKSHPGEAPVITGGRRIRGWQEDSGRRWKARATVDNFRQLYVNGVRARRARGGALRGAELVGKDGYTTTNAEMADWGNPSDIELCYYVVWTHSRCKVKSIARQGDKAVLTMAQPGFMLARNKEGVRVKLPSYVENALELLDEPGEWYLDRPKRTLYYIPRPGEDLKTAEVIAPALEKLIELRGTLKRPVHNIRFEGLTFADATWLGPSRIGHPDVQANFLPDPARLLKRMGTVTTVHNENIKSPSNIVCRAAKSIRFERCTFTRLGGGGIDLEYGAQDNVISGCRFHDISGTAIQIGDVLKDDHHPDDPRAVVRNNAVRNCVIHGCCVEYKGGVGIFVGYTDTTVIAHNEIFDLPYSGVSVGWGWGEEDAGGGSPNYHQPFRYKTPTPARGNRVEYNHIHHVMRERNDGGGIYTLSNQPGTIIRGNHIHDNKGSPGGIYLDEGSGFIEVTGNCVYEVRRAMNFNNRAQNRTATCKVHDNFFDARPEPAGKLKRLIDTAGLEPAYRGLLERRK